MVIIIPDAAQGNSYCIFVFTSLCFLLAKSCLGVTCCNFCSMPFKGGRAKALQGGCCAIIAMYLPAYKP